MTDTNDQPRPVIGRTEQPMTEPGMPAGKEVMQIGPGKDSGSVPVATPPVSSDAGGEQPGACATVPLPEPVASRAPNALAVGQWVYREPESFLEKLCRISDAIAYGEACAAREAAKYQAAVASATATMMDGTRAMMQLGRERDEQRARAEAAEADAARWKYAEAHLFRCDPDMGGNHRWWTQHLRGRGPTVAAVIDKEIADYTARKEAAEAKVAEMEGRR